MSETLKAADLNRTHLGMTVSASIDGATISDMLRGISHEADLIDDRKMHEEVPAFLLGRTSTVLTFAHAGPVQVAGNSEVRIGS